MRFQILEAISNSSIKGRENILPPVEIEAEQLNIVWFDSDPSDAAVPQNLTVEFQEEDDTVVGVAFLGPNTLIRKKLRS